jgi:hydroxyacylglutathione hydrolase
MNIDVFVVGAFEENAWLLSEADGGHAVFVDPGEEGDTLARVLRDRRLTLDAIWLTHAHIDHIGGIAALKRHFDVPVYLHPADLVIYERGHDVAQMYALPFEQPPTPERSLAEGDELALGAHRFRVMHVPGHAPGHVAFVGDGIVISGDCLFAGSVGRTDLPLADPAQLEASLERLAALDPRTRVLPGHGPETTIGRERATNPFLTGLVRQ